MAGFCDSVLRLRTPIFGKCEANSCKVSGRYRDYSRFPETGAGDYVRSLLRGSGRGQIRHFLQFRNGRIGIQIPPGAISGRIRTRGRDNSAYHLRRGRRLQDRALAEARQARERAGPRSDISIGGGTVGLMGLLAEESLIAQRLGKLGRKKTAA